jgi:eukaryotic-like serine/threonine-protein kinase
MARFWGRRRPAAARTTEEEVERVPPRRPLIWPWLLLLLALVLAGLAAAWYFATRPDTVETAQVPNVVGLKQAEAESRLRDEEFESEAKRVSSSRPAGSVVAQRPDSGTRYGKGGIVVVTVAGKPLAVEAPDVGGLPVARAVARLRAEGLRSRTEAIASRRPRGRVIRQIPDPGTEVPRGSSVVLIVSAGRQLVDVPDVVGLTADDATTRLTRAGFRSQIRRVPAGQPEGTVVAQQPGGGARAPRGQVVRINVSEGSTRTTTTVTTTTTTTATTTTTPSRATVPDTVGDDEATATSTLEGAGFRVRVVEQTVSDATRDGIVLRQSPAAGTTARSGSTVTITVGRLG